MSSFDIISGGGSVWNIMLSVAIPFLFFALCLIAYFFRKSKD